MSQLSCYDHYLYVHQIIIIFINIINFTIESDLVPVLESIVEVTDWIRLGIQLRLPHFELMSIEHDSHSRIDCHRKMILKWLRIGLASWSSLVEALKHFLSINEMHIAEQIIIDHPNNPSKYDTYNVCTNNES